MANTQFNARNGVSVGTSNISVIDKLGNISTTGNIVVTGTGTHQGSGVGLTNLAGSHITANTIPMTALSISSGQANDTTFLRGDGTWAPAATNLVGPITSIGNATYVAAQTGTGNVFVMNTNPTITGTLSTGNITSSGNITTTKSFVSNIATGTSPLVVSSTTLVTNLNADLIDGYQTSITATANTIPVYNSTAQLVGNVSGSAATLTTSRTINGVPFNGSANIIVTANASTLTGTTLNASVITSSLTSVGTLTGLTVSGLITANAGITVPTGQVVYIADAPVLGTSAANKNYVDSIAAGLVWKQSVDVATTTNITLSGTQIIDTYGVVAGSRVLVKNQTDATQNGIYVASTGAWVRALDMDATTPIQEFNGAGVYVTGGTVAHSKGTSWTVTSVVNVVGTDPVNWSQFTGASSVAAGTGLSLVGNQLNVNATQTQVTQLGNITIGTWSANLGAVNGSALTNLSGSHITASTIPNSALVNGNITVTAGNGLVGGSTVGLGGTTTLALPVMGSQVSAGFYKISTDNYGRVSSVSVVTSADIAPLLTNSGNAVITNSMIVNNNVTIGNVQIGLGGAIHELGNVTINGGTFNGNGASLTNIPNGALNNSSITVTAGAGLTGGGTVALGGSTTIALPDVGSPSLTLGLCSITTDAKGRVTTATPATQADIAPLLPSGASGNISVYAGAGLSGGGSMALGGSTTLSLALPNVGSHLGLGLYNVEVDINGRVINSSTVTPTQIADIINHNNVPISLLDGNVTIVAGTGLSGGGTVDLGASTTLSLSTVGSAMSTVGLYKISTDSYGRVASAQTVTSADILPLLPAGGNINVVAGVGLSGGGSVGAGGTATLSLPNVGTTSSSGFYKISTDQQGRVSSTTTVVAKDITDLISVGPNGNITVTAGTGLSGGGSVALGGTTTLSLPNVGTTSSAGFYKFATDAQGRVTSTQTIASSDITSLLSASNITITAGTGLSGGGSVALGGTTTLSLNLPSVGSSVSTGLYKIATDGQGRVISTTPATSADITPLLISTSNVGVITNSMIVNNKVAIGNVDVALGANISSLSGLINITSNMFNGSGAGLTSITNSSLVNSNVVIGNSNVSLGNTITSLGGLVNIQSNMFTGSGAGLTSLPAANLTGTTLPSTIVTSSLTSTGIVTSGTWSGSFGAVSGANLTSLTAGNLLGTIPSIVLANSTHYIGTTAVTLNRASGALALTGITSIDGTANNASYLGGIVASSYVTTTTLNNHTLSANVTSLQFGEVQSVKASTKYATGSTGQNVWIGNGGQLVAYDGSTAGSGSYNSSLGYQALNQNTIGSSNSAIGYKALYSNTDGTDNTAVGFMAGLSTTTGSGVTAIGSGALGANTDGYWNTAIGMQALQLNTSGSSNNAIGVWALGNNLIGVKNSAVGHTALCWSTGSNNTAMGYGSLYSSTTANSCSAVGIYALNSLTTGNNNTGMGWNSLYDLTTGVNNTAIGVNTGLGIIDGSNNTILGSNVIGLAASLSNNVIIADGAGNIRAQHNGTSWAINSSVTISGALNATTKSFVIPHPTKPGMTLQYGSLESPYHGVRLTGEGTVVSGVCIIKLPDYIFGLVKQEEAQVQITNYKHGKILWVEDINVDQNCFSVRSEAIETGYKFFWTFTGIRKDVGTLTVEY
jgi:hypothetical protein